MLDSTASKNWGPALTCLQGITIQQQLKEMNSDEQIKRTFVKEMSKGNTKAGHCLLYKLNQGSTLYISDIFHLQMVNISLFWKHLNSIPPSKDSILQLHMIHTKFTLSSLIA